MRLIDKDGHATGAAYKAGAIETTSFGDGSGYSILWDEKKQRYVLTYSQSLELRPCVNYFISLERVREAIRFHAAGRSVEVRDD